MKKWVLFLLLIGVKPLTGFGQETSDERGGYYEDTEAMIQASFDVARQL